LSISRQVQELKARQKRFFPLEGLHWYYLGFPVKASRFLVAKKQMGLLDEFTDEICITSEYFIAINFTSRSYLKNLVWSGKSDFIFNQGLGSQIIPAKGNVNDIFLRKTRRCKPS